MKVTLGAGVLVFWLVMTGLLFRREIWPTLRQAPTVTYRSVLAQKKLPARDRFELSFASRPLGLLQIEYSRDASDGLVTIQNVLSLRIPPLPAFLAGRGGTGETTARAEWTLYLNAHDRPARLSFTAHAPEMGVDSLEAHGWFKNDLFLSYRLNGGPPRALSLTCPPGTFLDFGFGTLAAPPRLDVGTAWDLTTIDVLGSLVNRQIRVQRVRLEATDLTEKIVDGKPLSVYVVSARGGGAPMELWYGLDGTLLRAQTGGFAIVRTP